MVMPAGEKLPTDDVVVINLDSSDHHDASAADGHATVPGSGPSYRLRTAGIALLGVGIFALGVFIGHTAAGNAAANEIRVFAGDITVGAYSDGGTTVEGSLPVLNDGAAPVEVVALDLPGYDVSMTDESVTVPASGRATVQVTIAGKCDAESGPAPEASALTLSVVASGAEHAVEARSGLAPDGMAAIVFSECRRIAESLEISAYVDEVRTDPADPGEPVTGRVGIGIRNAGDTSQVTGIRSTVPGFTIDADLPHEFSTSRTIVEVTWTVSDCAQATALPGRPVAPSISATVRTQRDDGTVMDTAVTNSLPSTVTFQLGTLAASSCPS